MNDLRTAAQQALDYWEQASWGDAVMVDKMDALRAALAEPVQVPVGAVLVNRESREGVMFYSVDMIPDPSTLKDRFELVPVYTAPPQRKPWVGLTEAERTDICDGYRANIHWRAFRAIEAKLQEKNT